MLTRIVRWWSAFTALTGMMVGFPGLLVTRFLFGVGEAGAYPNISAALARWFPARSRAQAQGWIWGASRFGGALAPLLGIATDDRGGGDVSASWRDRFDLGCLWFVWYKEPPGSVVVHTKTNWKELLSSRQMQLLF